MLKGTIIMLLCIYAVKGIEYIVSKISKYKHKDEQILIDITKERIENMTGYEFEAFCKWLFEASGDYSSVQLAEYKKDEGKDLILTCDDGEEIFVECKRYNSESEEELKHVEEEDFVIGRVICQKLVGAMVSESIKKGIIITTGSVHKNATEYINKLHKNSDIRISIMTMEDIVKLMEENKEKGASVTITV
ncbi:restriction endonuclease [Clostridium amazonitimonense]|uniref:restriction endonuclease n=1 Tax=Clostridium amazonitimonense TaxID=1499689 RepID=UPI00050959AD|nr:restriction endonuclease [Clostridium amazonitimonense]